MMSPINGIWTACEKVHEIKIGGMQSKPPVKLNIEMFKSQPTQIVEKRDQSHWNAFIYLFAATYLDARQY